MTAYTRRGPYPVSYVVEPQLTSTYISAHNLTSTRRPMTSRIIQVANHFFSPKMSDIHLYTAQTPNGIKASIALEELGLQYKVSYLQLVSCQS